MNNVICLGVVDNYPGIDKPVIINVVIDIEPAISTGQVSFVGYVFDLKGNPKESGQILDEIKECCTNKDLTLLEAYWNTFHNKIIDLSSDTCNELLILDANDK